MEISAINNRYNVATKSQYDTPVNTNYTYPANTNIDYPAYAEESSKKMPLGLILLGVLGATAVGIAIHRGSNAKKIAKSLEEKTAELEKLTKDNQEIKEKLTKENQEVKDKLTTAEKALEEAKGKINKYIQKGREARKARRAERKALNLVEKPEKTEKKGIFKRIKEKFSSIFNRNNDKA